MTQSLRGPALYKAIRDYIKQYILDHNLKPGDALPSEGQLVEDLGVGRSSVREAVKSLQSVGIVDVRQGDGLYVRELNFDPMLEAFVFGMQFDPHTLAELLQIRTWLEGAVIGDAVQHLSDDDFAKLEAILQEWDERVRAGEEYSDLDESFHQIIYGVLNNQTMMKLFSAFWASFTSLDHKITHDTDPQEVFKSHRAILNAIEARDISLTHNELLRHFAHVKQRINKYLGANPTTEKTSLT
ncbi:MAG: FadR/GntR family transcriptional regulator [Chloroflexi bacterium]|nr:FadR/GntR family transcriptional regulator [Chloroflexota bacterium]